MMSYWKNLWEEELVKIVELASIFAIFKGKNLIIFYLEMAILWIHYYLKNKVFVTIVDIN
jgi:hypothetical protein